MSTVAFKNIRDLRGIKLIHELVKKKLLAQTRISGKSKMYRLNKDSPLVKKFIDFYWSITNETVEKKQKVMVSY